MNARAPNEDEVEVNIFGPGYGECCLVHVGGGQWIAIDSCVDTESGRPAALAYLERVGVNPAESVKLVVASHWHDDHIRGLSSLLRTCVAAKFCASAALNKKEFLAVLAAYDQIRTIRSGSGAREIIATLAILKERNNVSHPIRATASKLLFRWDAAVTGHGQPAEVWSLSPSDGQYEKFLLEIGSMVPTESGDKLRLASQSPNHLSVVTWLSIGNCAFLFGADLEELGKPDLGWSAITVSETWKRVILGANSILINTNSTWTAMATSGTNSVLYFNPVLGAAASTTYTGSWSGFNNSSTFGIGANTIYNGSATIAAYNSHPTINVNISSTTGYTEFYSKPVETSISATATNYFIQHFASGGSTAVYSVDEAGNQKAASINVATARKGTFVCTAAGTITISNTNELATSDVIISLNTAGGTISTSPAMKTVTAGTGFTVLCGAADTSTYNYDILN